MNIETLINKLKNKDDFRSMNIYTEEDYTYIERMHIYFETVDKYNMIIFDYETGICNSFRELTKAQVIEKLKDKKIIDWTQ